MFALWYLALAVKASISSRIEINIVPEAEHPPEPVHENVVERQDVQPPNTDPDQTEPEASTKDEATTSPKDCPVCACKAKKKNKKRKENSI